MPLCGPIVEEGGKENGGKNGSDNNFLGSTLSSSFLGGSRNGIECVRYGKVRTLLEKLSNKKTKNIAQLPSTQH